MPAAIRSLAHRGPDNQSIKSRSKVSLGHARLSIIDQNSSSNQPMTDETGRYDLVYNGEIYNYKEIRTELELEGVRFRTQSDTEVLLQLLILRGAVGIDRLNGFFAFIFYDSVEEQILFARDRMGIKPLIIYEDDSKIILTSEMNTLFQFSIDKTIDEVPLNLFFRLGYVPASRTILKMADKILPGQVGSLDKDGLHLNTYYSVKKLQRTYVPFDEAADELRSRVNISVRDRLVSDVSLGALLSGGMDSSIISAVAKRYKHDIQTFSIGFDHDYFNESKYSRIVAKHIGSRHHEFIIGQKDFRDNFVAFLDAIDEPFGDSSAFAVYFLSKKTKEHVSVALGGDGADELFGGYRKQQAELLVRGMGKTRKSTIKGLTNAMKLAKASRSNKWGDLNRKVRKLSGGFDMTCEQRYFEWCTFVPEEDVASLLKPKFIRDTKWDGIMIKDMGDYLVADQQMVLPNDMLKKVDLMSMAHSLEVRTPFLDHRVVEFTNSLPSEYKIKSNGGKLILKHAFKDDLPKEILYRRKKGFEIPIQEWLGAEIKHILDSDIFSEEFIEQQGFFDYGYIRKLIGWVNFSSFGERIYLIWSLIVFQHWYKKYYA